MSKYQGPVFHKQLQSERSKPTKSPHEVTRTQKQTIVPNEIPFYKKHEPKQMNNSSVTQKKAASKTTSAYEDRTSTPFKVTHVPASFYSTRKKKEEQQEQINYQIIFQNLSKADDDFLLFEEYLSDFGKAQVAQMENCLVQAKEAEEKSALQMEISEEVVETPTEVPFREEETRTQQELEPVIETVPKEIKTDLTKQSGKNLEEVPEEKTVKPKKRGLSRSLAGMIRDEQDVRLNKGRNIARYFGETLEEKKNTTQSQPATISELLAQSRQNPSSNQLESLLEENKQTAVEKIVETESQVVEVEETKNEIVEAEIGKAEALEKSSVEESQEALEQPEMTATEGHLEIESFVEIEEPYQMGEQSKEPESEETIDVLAESLSEIEEPVDEKVESSVQSVKVEETELEEASTNSETSHQAEEVSQPATITELLARAHMDSSAQDLSALLGEEFAVLEDPLVVETEEFTEELDNLDRREVNEGLEESVETVEESIEETAEGVEIESEPIQENSEESSVQEEKVDVSKTVMVKEPLNPYDFPSIDLLQKPVKFETSAIDDWVLEQAEALNETLEAFNVEAQVVGWTIGPAITQFELQLGRGVKVNKITNLADDLKLSLAAKDIRIEAPIPGKSTVGVEVPNKKSRPVMISEVLESDAFKASESPLTIALGVNLAGETVITTIDKMPHGLIAGATGSGKSVFINSLLVSLLYKATPNEVKLILIDPKAVELAPYNGLPHLLSPVISEPKAANEALKWAVNEMEERYQKLAAAGVRNVEGFNKKAEKNGDYALKIPYIVIIIDELADLMMVASNEVQDSIARITQKARAAGIHLIVATQRPSVDVVTGTIKNNIPTRVAFMVSSQIDSRTILDNAGAEKLLGRGDMLFQGNGSSRPVRLQGTFVEDEIEDIVDYVKEQQEADYLFQSESLLERAEELEDKDELLDEVLPFIVDQGTVSASALQRKFRIGFNRASNLIDKLESKNLISGNKGSKPRDVFLTRTDYEEKFM